jgi:hypothetical protein
MLANYVARMHGAKKTCVLCMFCRCYAKLMIADHY